MERIYKKLIKAGLNFTVTIIFIILMFNWFMEKTGEVINNRMTRLQLAPLNQTNLTTKNLYTLKQPENAIINKIQNNVANPLLNKVHGALIQNLKTFEPIRKQESFKEKNRIAVLENTRINKIQNNVANPLLNKAHGALIQNLKTFEPIRKQEEIREKSRIAVMEARIEVQDFKKIYKKPEECLYMKDHAAHMKCANNFIRERKKYDARLNNQQSYAKTEDN